MFTSCYPAHFEDFASSDSKLLDSWVFDEVKVTKQLSLLSMLVFCMSVIKLLKCLSNCSR